MLEKAKKIIERATETTTVVSFVNYGFFDSDISELVALLENKPQISELDVSQNNLTAAAAAKLSSIKSLKRLSLAGNGIGNSGARILLNSGNFEFLDLSETGVTFEIADLLASRRAERMKVLTSNNPHLDPSYDEKSEDLELRMYTRSFEPNLNSNSSAYSWCGFVTAVTTFFGSGEGAGSSSGGSSPADSAKNPSVKKQ